MIIAGVALLVSFLGGAAADCPNSCSHRGTCNVFSQCECFAGRIGADCSERVCPSAQAWVGTPEGTDNAHQQAECANAGVCDRSSGQCECFKAFSGHACQRLVCPASAGVECSGHGKCLTMEHYATQLPTHDPYHYGLDGLHSLSHESFQVGLSELEALLWRRLPFLIPRLRASAGFQQDFFGCQYQLCGDAPTASKLGQTRD